MKLNVEVVRWPLKRPLSITGHVFEHLDLLRARVTRDNVVGVGEAYGVYYLGETADTMAEQLSLVRHQVEAGIDRPGLQRMLPPGGARAALDAALWDLEARTGGVPVWQLAGLGPPAPITTTVTIWGGDPDEVEANARALADLPALKLKLLGDDADADRVRRVRAAAPGARLLIDANQGLAPASYAALLPALVDARVLLIEQPFPVGRESWLERLRRPISVVADESVQSLRDLASLPGRFDAVNIKLDKCGGLTEGLLMVDAARRLGLGVMVGCMAATSLSLAPAVLLAQRADFADLDGPLFLAQDSRPSLRYQEGQVMPPDAPWGSASTHAA